MSALLMSATTLMQRPAGAGHLIFDCRYSLVDAGAGRRNYRHGHIPGAVYVDLEDDLSQISTPSQGRHPLPAPSTLRQRFGAWGIGAGAQVTVYDDCSGMIAARLWWMLRYMQFDDVTLLDGGWQAWVDAGGPIEHGENEHAPAVQFHGEPRRDRLVSIDAVEGARLLDARDPRRYAGIEEPIDPVAGHIPGARNHCWQDNLDANGCFLSAQTLKSRLAAALGAPPDGHTTHYCGSGVSACHNIFAQVLAGLPEPRLYCGSWSEWCRDKERQVMIGGNP